MQPSPLGNNVIFGLKKKVVYSTRFSNNDSSNFLMPLFQVFWRLQGEKFKASCRRTIYLLELRTDL